MCHTLCSVYATYIEVYFRLGASGRDARRVSGEMSKKEALLPSTGESADAALVADEIVANSGSAIRGSGP